MSNGRQEWGTCGPHLPLRSTSRLLPPHCRRGCAAAAGGGYGFLTPWHGLACDQLLSVTMVDANGDLVTASRGKNADLFAASCGGGGGNFGAWDGPSSRRLAARGWLLRKPPPGLEAMLAAWLVAHPQGNSPTDSWSPLLAGIATEFRLRLHQAPALFALATFKIGACCQLLR